MQKLRYTDKEMELIKSLFAEDEASLIALRKKLLDFDLTDLEKSLTTYNPESLKVIKKTFVPEIDGDAPLNQLVDMWINIDFKEKNPNEAMLLFLAKEKLVNYLTERLDNKKPKITFKSLSFDNKKSAEDNYVNTLTRVNLLVFIEQMLKQLEVLAGMKEETTEETKERLTKDSSK